VCRHISGTEQDIGMVQPEHCARCYVGAVQEQVALCRRCRDWLGRDASERWLSEWRPDQPSPKYRRAKRRQHRRRGPDWLRPDTPARTIVEFALTWTVFVVLGSVGAPEPVDLGWIAGMGVIAVVAFLGFLVIGVVGHMIRATGNTEDGKYSPRWQAESGLQGPTPTVRTLHRQPRS
jgi:hypothetical protein